MTQIEPIFFDMEATGLNPMAQNWWNNTEHGAQVLVFTFGRLHSWRYNNDYDDADPELDSVYDSNEYRLLKVAHSRLEEHVTGIRNEGWEPVIFGFNIRRYDLPYIGARYARKRLDGSLFTHELRRLDTLHDVATHDDDTEWKPKQHKYAEDLGIEIVEDEFDGKDVPRLFSEGRFEDIQSHCEADVETELRMFLKKRNFFVNQFYDHYNIEAVANYKEGVDL